MRKLATATAIGVILALTACLKPADAKQSENIKKAATYLAVNGLCKVDNEDWMVFARRAHYEDGYPQKAVIAIVKAEAINIVNYVVDNGKLDEFCLNGLRDMYGR